MLVIVSCMLKTGLEAICLSVDLSTSLYSDLNPTHIPTGYVNLCRCHLPTFYASAVSSLQFACIFCHLVMYVKLDSYSYSHIPMESREYYTTHSVLLALTITPEP